LYQNPEYFHHVLIFFVTSKYSALSHTHRQPKVHLTKNTQLHTHAEQLTGTHFTHTNIMHVSECVMVRTLLRRAEIIVTNL